MDSKMRYELLFNNINQYNTGDTGITRIAYTNEEQTCTHAFMRMCMAEQLDIRMDPCGNVIARRQGKIDGLPPVVMGSHLDTVYQGGKYDGVVGVTAALEVIRRLNEKEIITDHPIEIISFACEESARFGVSTVGSKAIAGQFDKDRYRNIKDKDGITMEKAFALCALDFNAVDQASRKNEQFKAFFELHIEQGPVLINTGKKIGIVTGIAAPVRLHVKIKGTASHSGTTPMSMRKDALLGASEISLALEKAAKSEETYGTVATIGVMNVHNGAMNVVPGDVEIKIDIRSTSVDSRQRVLTHLEETIKTVKQNRQLDIESIEISSEDPVLLSEEINDVLRNICEEKNFSNQIMQSGAGHDAMNMAKLCPTGLIFIPSLDGLSHHPNEYTPIDDIMIGIDLLEEVILHYSKSEK
ncbi:M20 family metallo-hydrolase [Psychrobacillus sp. FJAT-21963]|uniref:M20 family metallo-hydrolase n=1 Tax=Psychrobacillus sp. FJAT-21963 TaxID=1712028 RepID=UPI0006F7F782|nr:M20 family metallo-hydrolase [Psychrobacillus sp. FJAT-21963]KQL35366.1 N-carbamoyl-L-amino acid amidohydrolase [Psychrobacillus sp. FJAT-21963]